MIQQTDSEIPAQTPENGSRRGPAIMPVLGTLRASHWIKNVFVAAPLLFSGRFREAAAWLECLAAVGVFCLLASAMYIINDILDRQSDRQHPAKSLRPIASGAIPASAAIILAVILLAAGLGGSALFCLPQFNPAKPLLGAGLFVWACCYVLLMLAYSLAVKHLAVLDVIVVALGFVLRAMAGAAAIAVLPSPWLIVCTFCLCLFLALLKRRGELLDVPEDLAPRVRKALAGYSRPGLDLMIAAVLALSLATYCIYCLAPATVERFGSSNMVWTMPLAVYGLLRIETLCRKRGGDPFGLIIRDLTCWLTGLAYVLLTAAIWTWGGLDYFKILL
ncbi:MAG: UbiA prenyltransferase family protein [Planctomycetes bacterium]|nr:UbiA prenyltransferase family protein [Planctomycetota bacterium]